tara:strand:+ start:279 stop:566 length:288 start_codon:yes stop_codon:yes gene_type:complete
MLALVVLMELMVLVDLAVVLLDLVDQEVLEEVVMLVLVVHQAAVVLVQMVFSFKTLFQEPILLLQEAAAEAAEAVSIEMPPLVEMLVLFNLSLVA